MSKAWLPSAHLPDYLKSELQVGEAGMLPLLAALDEVVARYAQAKFSRLLDLHSPTRSLAEQRMHLNRAGLKAEQLNAAETSCLYDALGQMLQDRGSLSALTRLAQLYFPGAVCALGRPLEAGRLGRSHRVRLGDLGDRRRTVFVRTVADASAERVAEFQANAQVFLPEPYRTVVAFPKKEQAVSARLDLSTGRSWEKRRVECRISHR
ncbi:hypothetical protein K2X33_11325 [bacterium]|nr:hypothetical protein [bacterium]